MRLVLNYYCIARVYPLIRFKTFELIEALSKNISKPFGNILANVLDLIS